MANKSKYRYVFEIIAAVIVLIITIAVTAGMRHGILSSEDAFVDFIKSAGIFAPLVFVIVETVTVVILILPCAVGYPVSVVAFGPFWGFILNAISTIGGSIIIFAIVRAWGQPIVDAAVEKKNFKRYSRFMDNTKRFEKILAGILLLPFLPDNVLCYIAGLTKIKFKRFCFIIVLFKPWKILLYTYGANFFLDKFSHLWGLAAGLIDKIVI